MLQENQSTSAIIDVPGVERRLDVISDTPISQRPYSTDVRSQEIIDETVDKLLAAGIIEKSSSGWSSPVFWSSSGGRKKVMI